MAIYTGFMTEPIKTSRLGYKYAKLKRKTNEIWGTLNLMGRTGQVPNIEYIIKKLEILDRFHDFTPADKEQDGA